MQFQGTLLTSLSMVSCKPSYKFTQTELRFTTSSKHGVCGINYATGLFGYARTYLQRPGVFASDQLTIKEKDIQTRSAYIVNVDTHDKKGSHWLSIFVEKGQFEVFDNYGLPLHWYKPSPFVTWVFKHYQDVSSNVGQLQATDSNTCGHYALFSLFARARGKSMESFIQPFKYLCDVDNDHKIGENLRNDHKRSHGTKSAMLEGKLIIMGRKMGPNYACLFVVERKMLEDYQGNKPQLYKRYIDDVLGASSDTRQDLENFIEFCSTYHPSLKYTFEISESLLSFLDLCLTISDARITMTIHYKPTDTHSYLDYSSSHPPHCKKAIPYSQFLRLRRICSDDDVYVAKSKEMASFFENRQYPRSVVTNSQRRTQGISRKRTLGNSKRGDRA